jgi:geranylgeranyl pyrophosphate synthase
MNYSLLAGGKRIRPVIVLMVDDLLAGKIQKRYSADVLSIAVALECVHTYSLIHDDLPAMDDDDLRRGLPTCHIKFDEATAILAGDALLTFAFEKISSLKNKKNLAELIHVFAKLSGAYGMVGGQMLDLEGENKKLSLASLKEIHKRKTGALLLASVLMPVILRGKKPQRAALTQFGESIGIAFQIADDILDATSSKEVLGKSAGIDVKNQKSTYVSLLGLERAKREAQAQVRQAINALGAFKKESPAGVLAELAKYTISRIH